MTLQALLPRIAIVTLITSVLPQAFGGTVITNNLPTNTAIINVSGTQDGAASYNGDQSLWYHPFFTGGANQLLECFFPAGTYSFRVINPADAQQLFPTLTMAQTNQIFSAWTYNSPWIEDYLVFDISATNNTSPQLFDGAPSPAFSGPAAAYAGAVADGLYDLIRVGPLGRDSKILTNVYTLAKATTLIFVVPDYDLNDNAGGVSVLVAPAPVLSIAGGNGTATLWWATNAAAFGLEEATNLPAAPGGWVAVTNVPTVTNTNYFTVTVPVDATNRFFRLHQP